MISTPAKIPESPTDELRQVRYGITGNHCYIVQRKWRVQDSESVDMGGWHALGFPDEYREITSGRYAKVRDDWRDLPVVDAKDT